MTKTLICTMGRLRYIGISGKTYMFTVDYHNNPQPVEVDEVDVPKMLETGKFMVHESDFDKHLNESPDTIVKPIVKEKHKKKAYRRRKPAKTTRKRTYKSKVNKYGY